MKNYVGIYNIEKNKSWKTLLVTEGSDNLIDMEKYLKEIRVPVRYTNIEGYAALEIMEVWTVDTVFVEIIKELIRRDLISLQSKKLRTHCPFFLHKHAQFTCYIIGKQRRN